MSSPISVPSSPASALYSLPLPYSSPSFHGMGWGDLPKLPEFGDHCASPWDSGSEKGLSDLASP